MNAYRIFRDDYDLSPDSTDSYFNGDRTTTPNSMIELAELSYYPELILPTKFEFTTSNPNLKKIHMPSNDLCVDVFSNVFVEAITSVGNTDLVLVPVTFYDKATSSIVSTEFHAIFYREHFDCLDYEKTIHEKKDWSNYPKERISPKTREKRVLIKDSTILKAQQDGFPPIFRLLADSTLYISELARDAILSAGICTFDMVSTAT